MCAATADAKCEEDIVGLLKRPWFVDIQDLIQNVDTDPDFYVERIIKSLRVELADTSLPTYMPPPKNNTGPTGYIYFQYFDNHKCGGKLLSETGVGLDSCLSYPGMKLSYRVGLSQAGKSTCPHLLEKLLSTHVAQRCAIS